MCLPRCLFFFFQAEDGIRDKLVTGVQTCALPISARSRRGPRRPDDSPARRAAATAGGEAARTQGAGAASCPTTTPQIGRASCRERVEISVVAVSLKKKKKRKRYRHTISSRVHACK